jgi:nitroreductase/NAD-dependent dihydropyrimidine dehydrogenase PreA subunit
MIHIDQAKCTKCGFCADECPARIFVMGRGADGGPAAEAAYLDQCNRCGHCVAICPADAIVHDGLSRDGFSPIPAGSPTPEGLRALMLSRRSIRSFKDKQVPKEAIEQLIEVATHAGTASNLQTEGFVVIQDRSRLDGLEDLVLDTLWDKMKFLGNGLGRRLARFKYGEETANQAINYFERFRSIREKGELRGTVFRGAPTVMAIQGQRSNRSVHENCAIAARNMELLAAAQGLGTCWAGFLLVAAGMSGRIARHLGIPRDRNVYSALMLGYPKHGYRKTVSRRQREVRWL